MMIMKLLDSEAVTMETSVSVTMETRMGVC